MKIFLAKDGRSLGPFQLSELAKKLNTGEVTPTDLVYDSGSGNDKWVSILTYFNPVTFDGHTHYALKPQVTNRDLARTAMIRLKQSKQPVPYKVAPIETLDVLKERASTEVNS